MWSWVINEEQGPPPSHVLSTCTERDEKTSEKNRSLCPSTSTFWLQLDYGGIGHLLYGRSLYVFFLSVASVQSLSLSLSLYCSSLPLFFLFHSLLVISLFPFSLFVFSSFSSLYPSSPLSLLPPTIVSFCGHWVAADWCLSVQQVNQSALFFSPHKAPGGATAGDRDTCLWADISLPPQLSLHAPTRGCTNLVSSADLFVLYTVLFDSVVSAATNPLQITIFKTKT